MSRKHWKYLCEAAGEGNAYEVQDYIDAGVGVNISRKGVSALSMAASNSKWDSVKVLLEAGAKVNFVDNKGRTPFFDVCCRGPKDIIQACIDAGADVNITNKYSSPLCEVVRGGILHNIRTLLDAGANVNLNVHLGKTPLFLATENNRIDIVQAIIDAGAEIDVKSHGQTALHKAAELGSWKIVKILIDAGANVNIMNGSETVPLYFAAEHGPSNIVKAFVDAGVDVNETYKGKCALCLAACMRKWNNVKILLDAGANVNIIDSFGRTPLIYAAGSGPTYIVKAFIEAGVDVNLISCGHSALDFAAEVKMYENVKILIDAGANVNFINRHNLTPLFYAARDGPVDVIMLLIKAGANINSFIENGRNPINFADAPDRRDCCKVLIKYAILKHGSIILKHPINTELSNFWKECEKQVGIMEKVKLKCRLSLCEYLLETDANKLALSWSAENNDSESIFARQKGKYLEKFSSYAEDIKAQFDKGKERACLLLESMNCFSLILPEEIRRKICELMTNDDLKNFSSSIKITSSDKVTHSEISVFINSSNVLFLNSDGKNGSSKKTRRGRKRKLENQ